MLTGAITSRVPKEYCLFADMPDEITVKICQFVTELMGELILAWEKPQSPFPLVCQHFRAIYKEMRLTMLFKRAYALNGASDVMCKLNPTWQVKYGVGTCYQHLYSELNRSLSVYGHFEYRDKPIHGYMNSLLSSLISSSFPGRFSKLKNLIEAGAHVDSHTSMKKTPLLMVCGYITRKFMQRPRMSLKERALGEKRFHAIIDYLLKAGANPNFKGSPTTPLLILLYQQPSSIDDLSFIQTLVEKLVAAGGNPLLLPPRSDRSGFDLCPIDYVKEFYPALVPALASS